MSRLPAAATPRRKLDELGFGLGTCRQVGRHVDPASAGAGAGHAGPVLTRAATSTEVRRAAMERRDIELPFGGANARAYSGTGGEAKGPCAGPPQPPGRRWRQRWSAGPTSRCADLTPVRRKWPPSPKRWGGSSLDPEPSWCAVAWEVRWRLLREGRLAPGARSSASGRGEAERRRPPTERFDPHRPGAGAAPGGRPLLPTAY